MRWWRWMRRRWRGQAMGQGQPVRSGGRASAKRWRRWLAPSVAGGPRPKNTKIISSKIVFKL
eukprot:1851076-Rhodomonas_salina.1